MRRTGLLGISVVAFSVWARVVFAWGELGHHLIGRTAAKLVRWHALIAPQWQAGDAATRAFVDTLDFRWYEEGYVSNIPDIYWRDLEGGLQEDGTLLGNAPHHFNLDALVSPLSADVLSPLRLPLAYAEERERFGKEHPNADFFHEIGTNPWRAEQFADLYRWTLDHYPRKPCDELKYSLDEVHPTRGALTYAGLMSHFVGDSAQPYHATQDGDGVATGEAGIHWYFESDLVDGLEPVLDGEVRARAQELIAAPASVPHSVAHLRALVAKGYPDARSDQHVIALVLAENVDSYGFLPEVRAKDRLYAIAPLAEALQIPKCADLPQVKALRAEYESAKGEKKKRLGEKRILSADLDGKVFPACRRPADTKVDAQGRKSPRGKTVAEWNHRLIVDRLALASALLADIWTREWDAAGRPTLCSTWQYAMKPPFVSPTDPKCFGYALKENPKHFLKKNGKSALPWAHSVSEMGQCG